MSSISQCPPEIWLQVTADLGHKDLKSLSSTSWSLREIVASMLFKRLKFKNIRTKELDFMEPFVSKYGPLVTKLHYECELYPQQKDDAGNLAMPRILQGILAGDGLPNLQFIELSFKPDDDFNEIDADWSFNDGELGSLSIYKWTESGPDSERSEKLYQWRMDIRETFSAVMCNTQLEHLEITNLTPFNSSIWHCELWTVFLAGLKTFKLQLWGGENGACWHSNTIEGYGDFVIELQPNFFQHLKNLRSLHLAAEARNMIGCNCTYYIPFPIAMDSLPCLEELTLEHFFIDEALIEFLTQKSKQIRSIKFIDSWAVTEYVWGVEPVCWALFCKRIRETCPSSLVEFHITYKDKIEFNWSDGLESVIFLRFFDYALSGAEIEAARQRLANGVKLFPYGELDDKYGYAYSSDVSILKSLVEGSDLAEYEALMKLVGENRKAMLSS